MLEVDVLSKAASKANLWSYRHDLDSWFLRFAKQLGETRGGNPMVQLIEADPKINPYFVTFALYWCRVPGLTLAEKGLD